MRGLYEIAIRAELCSPVEFWRLYPWELYWLVAAKAKDTPDYRREQENERLYEMLKASRAAEQTEATRTEAEAGA